MNQNFLKKIKFILAGLFVAFGCFAFGTGVSAGDLTLHSLYVGQGDCTIIESNGHYMMIDAGYEGTTEYLVSYLNNLGVPDNKIDYAVATHPDADHIGGFAGLFDSYDVGQIIQPVPKPAQLLQILLIP